MVWKSWWSRLRRLPLPVIDAALALGLAVAVTIAIRVAPTQGAGRTPGAYSLGLVVAALVIFRRRWPLPVLLGSAVALQLYGLTNYPGIFPAVPLSVAVATAWAASYRRWTVGIVAWFGSRPSATSSTRWRRGPSRCCPCSPAASRASPCSPP